MIELERNEGIGKNLALEISALKTIADRTHGDGYLKVGRIICPQNVFEEVEYIANEPLENLVVIAVNTNGDVIAKTKVKTGTKTEINIHPRELFKDAIAKNAHGIFVAHNHPSGDNRPSDNDIYSTQKLIEAGKFLGVHVLDHLVVSKRGYYSLRENCDCVFGGPLSDYKFNDKESQNRAKMSWPEYENLICEEYGVDDPYALQRSLDLFEMALENEDGWQAYHFVMEYNIDNDEYDIDDCGEYCLYNPNEEWVLRVDISNDYDMYVYHKDSEEFKKYINYCKNNMILYTDQEYEEEYDI